MPNLKPKKVKKKRKIKKTKQIIPSAKFIAFMSNKKHRQVKKISTGKLIL